MEVSKCESCTNESQGYVNEKLLCNECITKSFQQDPKYFARIKRVGRKPTNRYWFKGRVLLGIGAVQGCYQISNTREYDWNPSDQTLAEKAAEPDTYAASQNGELYALLFEEGGIEQFDEEDRKLISARAAGVNGC